MLSVCSATKKDLSSILALQRKNLSSSLSLEEQTTEGFVTVQHRIEQLVLLHHSAPQIIAKENEIIVGYALVMPPALKSTIAVLTPLFERLSTLKYKGIPLQELRYYVMGQICVAKSHRGQGVVEKLYATHRAFLAHQYDYCITEISTRNLRSMRAHIKQGFELIHQFSDATDEWNIVLWDWTK